MSDLTNNSRKPPPHWSKDPEEKHFAADYTIKLKNENETGEVVAVYRVHKSILVKYSGYFKCFFKQNAFSQTNEYTLAHEMAVDAFPILLKWLYSSYNSIYDLLSQEEGEFAVALVYFADYLDIPILAKQVNRFFDGLFRHNYVDSLDLKDYEDHGMYYRDAVLFFNHELKARIATFFARQSHKIKMDSGLPECFDVQFWVNVSYGVKEAAWDEPEDPLLGELFAKVCSNLIADLDEASLSDLTGELDAGWITVQAAIELFAVAARVAPDTAGSALTVRQLTALQRTCVQTLQLHFKDTYQMIKPLQEKLGDNDQCFFVLNLVVERFQAATDAEKALEIAEKVYSFPESIIVNGAGRPEVNGRYILFDSRCKGNYPRYKMDGTWNGKPVLFTLDSSIGAEDDKCYWKIRANEPEKDDDGNYSNYDTVYWAFSLTTGTGADRFPPTFSWWWWSDVDGIESPTVEYEYPDGHED